MALAFNSTADFNSAFGALALANNVTGAQNTAVGLQSLGSNGTGSFNTGTGSHSLFRNTTGSLNTAHGTDALFTNTVGTQNSAVGSSALYNNNTGNYNAALGYEALFTNQSGESNTAIGYQALRANISGVQNTGLGFAASLSTFNLSNATAIGARSYVGCSNCMVLGSTNGLNGASSNVNVGLSEPNPRFPLSFPATLGDKISLWSTTTNSFGFGIQGSQLQIHTDQLTSDIVFGYGSSSVLTETMRLKGNGNLEVQELKIGNGTLISKQQAGTAVVGTNGTNFMTYTLNFPTSFSSIPKVTANAKNDPVYSNVNDTFCVTIRSITNTSVTFNILRVDATAGWLQNLLLDWMAWE
jgi:hypothetical protein